MYDPRGLGPMSEMGYPNIPNAHINPATTSIKKATTAAIRGKGRDMSIVFRIRLATLQQTQCHTKLKACLPVHYIALSMV